MSDRDIDEYMALLRRVFDDHLGSEEAVSGVFAAARAVTVAALAAEFGPEVARPKLLGFQLSQSALEDPPGVLSARVRRIHDIARMLGRFAAEDRATVRVTVDVSSEGAPVAVVEMTYVVDRRRPR